MREGEKDTDKAENAKIMSKCKASAERHIEAVILKNRNGQAGTTATFKYYAKFNCFVESVEINMKTDKKNDIFHEVENWDEIQTGWIDELLGKYYLEITRGTKGGQPRRSLLFGTEEENCNVVEQLRIADKQKAYPDPSGDGRYTSRMYTTPLEESCSIPFCVLEMVRRVRDFSDPLLFAISWYAV